MNKLLIASEDAPEYARYLHDRELPNLEIVVARSLEEARPSAEDANIILGRPNLVVPLLNGASRLQWVQSTFAGIEPFCAPGLRTDYTLTGVKGVFGPLMSEYVFTYILARERNLLATRENQLEKRWKGLPYRSLAGVSIGICGLGSIGQQIARTAEHFRMRVLGLSRSAKQVPSVEKVYPTAEICELARHVDYLVVVLPNTPETVGFINEEVFRSLGAEAVLINVGRGAAVDEAALIEAVQSRQIGGAVLDVFCEEPLPEESPLWGLENVFITPHNAAFTFPGDIARIFSDNYARFIAGEPLQFVIDIEQGY